MNFSFMDQAMEQANLAFSKDEVPVGVVIVDRRNNEIIAKAHNLVESKGNPTLHAEMVAIGIACDKVGKNLSNCDIYVTLEPCCMCAAAISYSRLGRLYYAASDKKQGSVENGLRFFASNVCFYRPEVYVGIRESFSMELMKSFFRKIRNNGL